MLDFIKIYEKLDAFELVEVLKGTLRRDGKSLGESSNAGIYIWNLVVRHFS